MPYPVGFSDKNGSGFKCRGCNQKFYLDEQNRMKVFRKAKNHCKSLPRIKSRPEQAKVEKGYRCWCGSNLYDRGDIKRHHKGDHTTY